MSVKTYKLYLPMLKTSYFALSVLYCIILLVLLFLSEVPVDSGDGLAHFFIAQNVWQNPEELLNHWGKPLFTLFAAPFAYFGYSSYVVFNVLIYAATVWLAYLTIKRIQVSNAFLFVFPIGLLTSLDYTANILGGMTEVLFGFLVLLSGLMLLQQRWIWFAIIISFTPFSRSEGQLLVPIAMLVLSYFKAWRALPFLFLGFILYSFVGFIVLDDFLWYFNNNPYGGAADIYGQGNWTHYINYWYVHLGLLGMVLMLVCVPIFFVLVFRKKLTKQSTVLILYFSAVYFGILLTHMYLWANGKSGALGLTRLAIHGWPGLLLSFVLLLGQTSLKTNTQKIMSLLLVGFSAVSLAYPPFVHDKPFPRTAKPDEKAVLDAAHFADSLIRKTNTSRVFYYHPLVAYAVDVNLKDTKARFKQQNFSNFEAVYSQLSQGDLVIVDSHFGYRDMNFPVEHQLFFYEIEAFTPLNQYVHEGDSPARVLVLGKTDGRSNSRDILTQKVDTQFPFDNDDLYIPILELPSIDFHKNNQKIQLEIKRNTTAMKTIYLVIQSAETGQSLTLEIPESRLWHLDLNRRDAQIYKFFIHNPNQSCGTLDVKINLFHTQY